jgi:hypothetical protein
MSDHDAHLAELLSDAVSDIEPTDRLDAIRERTRVTPIYGRRRRLYAVGGTVLATAAVVTAIALASHQGNPAADDLDPGNSPTGAVDPSPTQPTEAPPAIKTPVAVYYVGDGPRGPRLFRYLQPLAGQPDIPATRLDRLTATPTDSDYRTLWPEGAFTGQVSDPEADMVFVGVDDSVHDRPAGMTEAEAQLAIEQVLYTLHDEFPEVRAVQFRYGANPIDQVFGVPTSEPLTLGPVVTTLSLMSINHPTEGQAVSGSFVADGLNNGYEATYRWQLHQGRADGPVVDEGFGMASGCCATDRLFPWATDPIDVSSLEPGTYTFVAMNDDPSGGAEGNGPDTDTRTIVVE